MKKNDEKLRLNFKNLRKYEKEKIDELEMGEGRENIERRKEREEVIEKGKRNREKEKLKIMIIEREEMRENEEKLINKFLRVFMGERSEGKKLGLLKDGE